MNDRLPPFCLKFPLRGFKKKKKKKIESTNVSGKTETKRSKEKSWSKQFVLVFPVFENGIAYVEFSDI